MIDDGVEPDDEVLMRLLSRAGRRPEPPTETREAVYLAALLTWKSSLQERRRRRRVRYLLAIAATFVVAALGVLWQRTSQPAQPLMFASVTSGAHGGVRDGHDGVVRVGDELEGDAPLVLLTGDGHGLRLAGGAVARAVGPRRLLLARGSAYFESRNVVGAGAPFEIETSIGVVTHVGTRFGVSLSQAGLHVLVRDGHVAVQTRTAKVRVPGGTQVTIEKSGTELDRKRVASFGPAWAWADELAPPLRLDGRPLVEVLEEIAYQSGRQLSFASDGVRNECQRILLNGPLLELSTGDRLFAVLVTTGFEAIESGERIIIQRKATIGAIAR